MELFTKDVVPQMSFQEILDQHAQPLADASIVGGNIRGASIKLKDTLEFLPTSHGGYILFKEEGVKKIEEYWDVDNHYWGVYPTFGGYAYGSISLNQSASRLAFVCPGNTPYIQQGFWSKKIMFHCDETTDTEDFSITPGKIELSRDYIDLG